MRGLQPAMAIGEEQFRVAVNLPELTQGAEGGVRQRDEAIPVAFGIANMHPLARRIDVADLQCQPFAQAQAQTVEGKIEHPIAQRARGGKKLLGLVDRDNVGQPLDLGRFDQMGHDPGFVQDVGGVELQAIQIKFDCAPGVGLDQVAEIVGQLGFGEVVDLVGEVSAQAPDGAGISLDGLGLQPLELEVLEMRLVLPVKVFGGACCRHCRHAGLSSRNIAQSNPSATRG